MKILFRTMLLASLILIGAACAKSDPPATDQNQTGPEKPVEPNTEFVVDVSDVGTVTVNVHIKAKDKDKGYFSDVLAEKDFQQAQKFGFDDYLNYVINTLMESSGKSFEEAVQTITSYGSDDYNITTLKPNSKYYAVAVGIDDKGKSTTEVFSKEFVTKDIEASDNTFDLNISDINEFGAKVSIKTGNNDPYFMEIVPAGVREELGTERDIRYYLIESHLAAGDIEDFILSGSVEKTTNELKPGWKYDVIVFGCKDGFANTDAAIKTFSTVAGADDPALCEFEFDCTLNANKPSVFAFYPSDPTAVYICDAMFASDYQMILEASEGDVEKAGAIILDEMINIYAGDFGTRAETLNLVGTVGPYEYSMDIEPGEDYMMWAVCVDQKGVPTGKFIVSEIFKAPDAVVSSATVKIIGYPWFDGDKLYEKDPSTFKGAKGNAVVKLKVEPSADAKEWWAYVFYGDLRESPDRTVIKNLVEYGLPDMKGFTEGLIVAYWGESTICAVAKDAEGNFGVPVRVYFDMTKEGASPIEQLQSTASRQLSAYPMMTAPARKADFSYRSAGRRVMR